MNRNRLILLVGALGAAALLAVVLVLVGRKSSNASSTTAPTTPATPAAASSSLAGLPQHGDTLGKPNAPATLIVYEDPQCPYCRAWNTDTLPTVVKQFVRTGKINLVYRGIVIIGPDSVRGLHAIYAAAGQNKLWNLVDALYAHQGAENSGWITNSVILTAAQEAGANGKAIVANMGSPAVDAALTTAETDAKADQVQGTPTFVLERPPARSQQLSVTGLDPASFIPALSAALQG